MNDLRSAVRRLVLGLAALLLAVGWSVAAVPTAHAEDDTPSSWRISKYHVTATPSKDGGTTTVEIDMDFDFANDPGHGPFIVLVERQRLDDPDVWRMLDTKIISVSSGTGANVAQQITHENGAMLLRLGTEGRTFRGVQNYRITYTVHGILYPDHPTSKMDEFNWNAVGNAWQVPMSNVQVTLKSPAEPRRTACWWGSSYQTECEAPAPSTTMVWQRDRLAKGQGLQVVAGYPVGTFTNAEFRTTKRYHVGNMFPVTPVTLGGAGVVGAAAIGGVGVLVRRRGADKAWAGLTPGTMPLAGQSAPVVNRRNETVAVAFRPPKGATPGEVGTLVDEKADLKDVTATLIDLAVRGHVKIEQSDPKNQIYHRTPGRDQLNSVETQLLNGLFSGARVVTTEQLKKDKRGKVFMEAQANLYRTVSTEPKKWFRENPNTARTVAVLAGMLLVLAGGGLMFLGGLVGWGIVPLGVVVAGVVLMVLSGRIPSRTPAGSAVYAEAKGFELYLKTADAEQIRFEEDIDVFSRYLPYAIAFGVADRWARIFEKLAAEGRYYGDTSWYVGNAYGHGYMYGIASTVNSVTQSMQSAMQSSVNAANQSSSGSGFGGGGGAGGGGGGGW
ncbi:DUF2207 domain-containing protein [Propionibacteriaceae bacterium G57]|uniref:DUF2207 domain-containing protein n=1 Tax=Aestuariimicrobium sp. G57 TaxID=3418485 RepID=UPI003DA78670